MDIRESVARKVLTTVDAGLSKGMGTPEPGQMCVEAAVNYALGADHGDQPACVSPVLRRLKIRLNDSNWSSKEARAKGLRRLALAQLGSAGALDEKEFTRRVVRLAIQKSVPEALRAAATVCKHEHHDKLLAAASACEADPTHANAWSAKNTAAAAAYAADAAAAAADAAYAAAAYADAAAAYAAYADAAYAAAAAAAAAYAAAAYADAAYADAAYAAAAYAADAAAADAAKARDTSLASFCEAVVQILIDMQAPGCQWLWLTEEQAA
jgi:hypothetical protein